MPESAQGETSPFRLGGTAAVQARSAAALAADAHSRRATRPTRAISPGAILSWRSSLMLASTMPTARNPKRNRRACGFASRTPTSSPYPRRRHRQAAACPLAHIHLPALDQAAACFRSDRPPPGDAALHDWAGEADPAEVNFLLRLIPVNTNAIRTFRNVLTAATTAANPLRCQADLATRRRPG